jgi:hypothetical protein
MGIPRRAFEWALSTLDPVTARRGFREEWFVRLAPDSEEAAVLRALQALTDTGMAEVAEEPPAT